MEISLRYFKLFLFLILNFDQYSRKMSLYYRVNWHVSITTMLHDNNSEIFSWKNLFSYFNFKYVSVRECRFLQRPEVLDPLEVEFHPMWMLGPKLGSSRGAKPSLQPQLIWLKIRILCNENLNYYYLLVITRLLLSLF